MLLHGWSSTAATFCRRATMPQGGGRLARLAKPARGGRANVKHSSKLRKGSQIHKPKRASLSTKLNESRRLTAAITRNIEKEMGSKVQNNGGALSTLKGVASASKPEKDESKKGSMPKTGSASKTGKKSSKVKRGKGANATASKAGEAILGDIAPKFNPKRRFKL